MLVDLGNNLSAILHRTQRVLAVRALELAENLARLRERYDDLDERGVILAQILEGLSHLHQYGRRAERTGNPAAGEVIALLPAIRSGITYIAIEITLFERTLYQRLAPATSATAAARAAATPVAATSASAATSVAATSATAKAPTPVAEPGGAAGVPLKISPEVACTPRKITAKNCLVVEGVLEVIERALRKETTTAENREYFLTMEATLRVALSEDDPELLASAVDSVLERENRRQASRPAASVPTASRPAASVPRAASSNDDDDDGDGGDADFEAEMERHYNSETVYLDEDLDCDGNPRGPSSAEPPPADWDIDQLLLEIGN